MNITIYKLEEAAKMEQEKVTATEWEITESKIIGVLPWETEEEYNHRIELLYKNLHNFYENLNQIKDLIKIIKDRD